MALLDHQLNDGGWQYSIYSSDTPASDLPEEIASFKRLWDSKRKDKALPAWRDFELEDFHEWYGWISVDDIVSYNPYNSVFRLWGTNLVNLYQFDLTNKYFRDFLGTIFNESEAVVSADLCKSHNFRVSWGPIDWNTDMYWLSNKHIVAVDLPLGDDGNTVDKYLNLALPVPTPGHNGP